MNTNITLALTSCWRFNLLKKSITSIEQSCDISQYRKILTEDSKNQKHIEKMQKANKDGFLKWWEIIYTGGSWHKDPFKSHYSALERLYSEIKTKYVFHLEDDWYFRKTEYDYIQLAIEILEKDKNIGSVWYYDIFRTTMYNFFENKEVIKKTLYLEKKLNFFWFSFYVAISKNDNEFAIARTKSSWFWLWPSIKRTDEMKKVMFWFEDAVDEVAIWNRFCDLWLIAINYPIYWHIWDGIKSTRFWKDWFIKSILRASKNAFKFYILRK